MKKRRSKSDTYFFKKVIKIPIYFGNFIIIFSDDPNKVSRVVDCQPQELEYMYAHMFHNFMYNNLESFAVVFNFWDSFPITMGAIMHEVNHVGNRILQSREFIPDWSNDEAECYLKSWLADQVEQFIKRCNITKQCNII